MVSVILKNRKKKYFGTNGQNRVHKMSVFWLYVWNRRKCHLETSSRTKHFHVDKVGNKILAGIWRYVRGDVKTLGESIDSVKCH